MREKINLLSIVFSFRNEESVLEELIQRVVAAIALTGLSYEIIFINDASTDRSLEILTKHNEINNNIKIINMSRRFGVHQCVMAGLRYSSGDIVIYMDSDLQDPPELIPDMVDKYLHGADVVNMTRTDRRGESTTKMWITKLAYKAINSLSDISIPENTGDFKLLSRQVVNHLLTLQESDPFMRGLVYWVGFRQDTIYYVRDPRFSGDTHFSLLSGGPIKEFLRGITSFSVIPLYLSMFIGFLATLVAFGNILSILVLKFMGKTLPGWTAIMTATLFLGGTLHISLGIIGIYIGKIYTESKKRPHYIVSNIVGTFGLSISKDEISHVHDQ